MTLPFTGSEKWEKVVVVSLIAVLLLLFVGYLCSKPQGPTLEDRVEALKMEVRMQQDQIVIIHETMQQTEEAHEETVYHLWEVINVTEKRCEECLHSCGGID